MSDFRDRINNLTPKRLALLALELHDQVEAMRARAHEPVAVVGFACRFPGASDIESFWELLRDGRDAIGEVPKNRWDIDAYFDPDPDRPGHMAVRAGGFLADVAGFDAGFFGIAPREALSMDPQQRLLLEVAWEALEHAGIAADRLSGSSTGVFVGICNNDHFQRVLRGGELIDAYVASGHALSVAAGRISFCLGLQGPALSIDTACSSSLAALHVACRSLRNGETRMALCGGVNVMCSPETTVALSRGHMLAPDGRCKTFDARADGFSRGEGCGVLVLKRLNDAVADGDRILAVLRGTAVNQDGRSSGLTVPNGPAQEAVIRAALADGRVDAADISYVEAHGTGTSLGDPIEVRALAGALGAGRSQNSPLAIGSVKTNIGHLESAAGIAGVIKVILSLQHEYIPPHLHFSQPSPHIPWSEFPVSVTSTGQAWPRAARPRLAGVSSFGFSGTNVHVVVEEAPQVSPSREVLQRPQHCLPLSARSETALTQIAQRYIGNMSASPDVSLVDIAHTAGAGRSHFDKRVAVVADTVDSAKAALGAFAAGEPHSAVHQGTAVPGQAPEVVFLFTGQGCQYPGMSRLLYETSPAFRDVIDRCDTLLGPDANSRTLKTVLWSETSDPTIHDTAWTQPALFAVEYGLAQLWRSWGIEPAAVIGHSVGEYVAACVAGVFAFEEGLRLIAERGRLMGALPPGGAMAAVFAGPEVVAAAIAAKGNRVAIAAINAPENVVISGEATAVDALLEEFAQREVRGQKLFVSLAAHSPLVEPALDALEACARTVPMQAPSIPVAWNLTGTAGLESGSAPDAIYWRRHLREPVQFAAGIASLYRDGYRTFLEVGPHPTLISLTQQSLPNDSVCYLASLRRDKNDWDELLCSLAKLYVHGSPVNWEAVNRPYSGRRLSLPTYPFERQHYWLPSAKAGTPWQHPMPGNTNPLLGSRLPAATPIFETVLKPEAPPYLSEHQVCGAVLVAAPVFLEMAQACARETFGQTSQAIEGFVIHEPLALPKEGRSVQIHLQSPDSTEVAFSIYSRDVEGKEDWKRHVSARLVRATESPRGSRTEAVSLDRMKQMLGPAVALDQYYKQLASLGIELGPTFRGISETHRNAGEALALVEIASARSSDNVVWAHPALLDGVLQVCGLTLPDDQDSKDLYLLTEIERLELTTPLPNLVWCHARLRDADQIRPSTWHIDLALMDGNGAIVGRVNGASLRRASRETLRAAAAKLAQPSVQTFYRVAWEPAEPATPAAASLAEPKKYLSAIRDRFRTLSEQHRLSTYDQLLPELDRLSADHLSGALRQLGFDDSTGRSFTVHAEATRLGVLPRHVRLFSRMLEMLVEDGILRPENDGFEVVCPLTSTDPNERYDALLAQFSSVDGELRMLRRCGGDLARVLTGHQDPLQLLFPGGSFAEARQLYVESPYARTYNGALGEAVKAAISKLPAGSRLRVLEIGAGTGGTTTYVLPLLPADRVEYTFTDLSRLFLERATGQFSAYPFLRPAILDIERHPASQGFEKDAYDIVIASNVIHATANLRESMQNVRSLLAPGGLLLLLEGVAPERWVDLSFGLTEGWWRFSDEKLRESYPLISREKWHDLLSSLDFDDVSMVPDGGQGSRVTDKQVLMLARKPSKRRIWSLVGESEVGTTLATHLRARGDTVKFLKTESVDDSAVEGEVVYLGALELAARKALDFNTVDLCKALACDLPLRWLARSAKEQRAKRIWLVTQGVQSIGDEASPGARWQSPIWGLGRTFAIEHPDRFGGLVDLPPEGSSRELAEVLLKTFDGSDGEDQVAWRGAGRFVPRVVPVPAPKEDRFPFRPDATYLITGGFGGIGLQLARWMAENGARHLALLGRHPDTNSDEIRAIEDLGVQIVALEGDVADAAVMTEQFARLAREAPPLRGIMHAAVSLSFAPIENLTQAQVASMLRAKIDGTVLLERLTRGQPIDFWVLFSSAAAPFGGWGFAHYSAANAFLDTTAQISDQTKCRVLTIDWGAWERRAELKSAESQRFFRESGFEPMPAREAFDALGRLLGGPEPQTIVARIDWNVVKPRLEAGRSRPFLSTVVPQSAQTRSQDKQAYDTPGPSLLERLANGSPASRKDLLAEFVRTEVAAVLGLRTPDLVDPSRSLFNIGMDSLMAIELKTRLERAVAAPLPSALAFNYPTVTDLVRFLDSIVPEAVPITDDDLQDVNGLLSRLPDMPIAEVDLLLAKMLGEERQA